MAIKYVSKHHSPDDPGGLIREALDMGADFPGPAEDLILAWMLGLGTDRDAADAARGLMTAYGFAEGPVPQDETGRIIEMLRQTAEFPQERLSGRSRGGPGGRPGRRRGRGGDGSQ